MIDRVNDAIERLTTIEKFLTEFQTKGGNLNLLQYALNEIEELHDDIEEIIDENE